MNGKDGKPFKTREGGVMRLESLLNEIEEEMFKKITDNPALPIILLAIVNITSKRSSRGDIMNV